MTTLRVRAREVVVESPPSVSDWERVVAGDPLHLASHTPAFVAAMAEVHGLRDLTRLYRFPDGRGFVLPLLGRQLLGRTISAWSPPPACGFGGLVGAGLDAEVIDLVAADLAQTGVPFISIRPDPLLAASWAGLDGPGIIKLPRQAHIVRLEGDPEQLWRASLTKKTRQAVRRAEREGVRIERGRNAHLVRSFQQLYDLSLRRWAAAQREPLRLARWRARRRDPVGKLESILATGNGEVWVAWLGERPAAASVVLRSGHVAHDTRGAIDIELAATRANDLLQWRTISAACREGATWYHLGESRPGSTLARYKERFGGRPIDYHEIRHERLPISQWQAAGKSLVKGAIGMRDA